jgi:chemotaxis protein MotA
MLIVEGIMAIQAGVSPRVVEEMLMSHVPPAERDELNSEGGSSSVGQAAA